MESLAAVPVFIAVGVLTIADKIIPVVALAVYGTAAGGHRAVRAAAVPQQIILCRALNSPGRGCRCIWTQYAPANRQIPDSRRRRARHRSNHRRRPAADGHIPFAACRRPPTKDRLCSRANGGCRDHIQTAGSGARQGRTSLPSLRIRPHLPSLHIV